MKNSSRQLQEKSIDDRQDDFFVLFGMVLSRINENRPDNEKIIIPDSEIGKACLDIARTYNDVIVWRD